MGDEVEIVSDEPGDGWVTAKLIKTSRMDSAKSKGIVPSNYLKMIDDNDDL